MANFKTKFHSKCIGLLSHLTVTISAQMTGLALITYVNRPLGT